MFTTSDAAAILVALQTIQGSPKKKFTFHAEYFLRSEKSIYSKNAF